MSRTHECEPFVSQLPDDVYVYTGRQRAVDHFSWKSIARKTLALSSSWMVRTTPFQAVLRVSWVV